jgi:hypothetical protein
MIFADAVAKTQRVRLGVLRPFEEVVTDQEEAGHDE